VQPPSAAIRQPGTSHSFTTGQNQCNHHQQPSGSREPVIPSLLVRKGWNHHQQPSGTREPVIPSLLVRKGWNHHQEAIRNPGTGHSFTTGQKRMEPPSAAIRKPGTGPLMPATISVVDQISGRNIRLTQARETIFNNLTGR